MLSYQGNRIVFFQTFFYWKSTHPAVELSVPEIATHSLELKTQLLRVHVLNLKFL